MAYYETYMPNENGELQRVVINAGVGFCLPFYGEVAPPGTLACDGSEISRATYSELFDVLGTKAGAGDGVSTFNLPDLRGMFIRGTGGNAAALGVEQGDAIRELSGGLATRSGTLQSIGSTQATVYGKSGVFADGSPQWGAGAVSWDTLNTYAPIQNVVFRASNVVPTAAENRPVNVALLWCIIYE